MSRIKIFVEPKDNETWDAICNKVYNGTIKRIDFKGVEFEKVKHGYLAVEPYHYYDADSAVEFDYYLCTCSLCKTGFISRNKTLMNQNYCPNCGAKMDAERREDEIRMDS